MQRPTIPDACSWRHFHVKGSAAIALIGGDDVAIFIDAKAQNDGIWRQNVAVGVTTTRNQRVINLRAGSAFRRMRGRPLHSTMPLSIDINFAARAPFVVPFDPKVFSAAPSCFAPVSVPMSVPPSGSVAEGSFRGCGENLFEHARLGLRANGGPPFEEGTTDKPSPASTENTDDAGMEAALGSGCAHATPTRHFQRAATHARRVASRERTTLATTWTLSCSILATCVIFWAISCHPSTVFTWWAFYWVRLCHWSSGARRRNRRNAPQPHRRIGRRHPRTSTYAGSRRRWSICTWFQVQARGSSSA